MIIIIMHNVCNIEHWTVDTLHIGGNIHLSRYRMSEANESI